MAKEFIQKYFGLLKKDTPLIFADGTDVYKALGEKHIKHKNGYFVLAPSGSGKTYYIDNQKEPHWVDGDEIWTAAKAHPEGSWWLEDLSVIDEIEQRCDIITVEAKKLGFWVMGASNVWLKPDAVVIPDWETHQKYILHRENNNYDGGATSENLDRVKKVRDWMSRWGKEGVPIFRSIEEAVKHLESK